MNDLLDRARRSPAAPDDPPLWEPGPPSPHWAGLVATIVLIAGAMAVGVTQGDGGVRQPGERPAPPVEVSAGVTSYAPGQSSGWHSHPGVHRVRVVTGRLTVYDGACTAVAYGPGDEYVGGDQVHLARNETDSELEMAVTYVLRPEASVQHFRVDEPAPTGCDLL